MNIENSRALAEIVNTYGLTRLEVSEGDVKIVIEKNTQNITAAQIPVKTVAVDLPSAAVASNDLVDFNNMIEVKSPIVGVFYAAPSPESAPFVSMGSKVKKGDVLCIVEAMKLLNEIQAEQDGEIIDICIKNGDIAEFGQVLFKMV